MGHVSVPWDGNFYQVASNIGYYREHLEAEMQDM